MQIREYVSDYVVYIVQNVDANHVERASSNDENYHDNENKFQRRCLVQIMGKPTMVVVAGEAGPVHCRRSLLEDGQTWSIQG